MQSEIFRRRRFHKIIALDVKVATERNSPHSGIRILGIVDRIEFFGFSFGIICQHDFDGPEHGEPPCGYAIKFVAHGMFQQRHIGHARILRDADVVGERAQHAGRHTTPAQAGNRDHARVVPPAHQFFIDELDQFALADDRVGQIEPRKFILMWTRLRKFQRVEDPVIKRPVHFEFQRANRVRDPFDVIAERVRPVVHWINAPFLPGAMMRCVPNAVQHRIAQPYVRRVHVNFRA